MQLLGDLWIAMTVQQVFDGVKVLIIQGQIIHHCAGGRPDVNLLTLLLKDSLDMALVERLHHQVYSSVTVKLNLKFFLNLWFCTINSVY